MKRYSRIKSIKAKKILNSKNKPTIEVELKTNSGKFLASVPSGTSKGKYEATEKKADVAVKNVNKIIAPKLKGKDVTRQKEIDKFLIRLDGTKNKSRLGANAILAVSIAVLRAGAKANNLSLWKWISKIAKRKPSLPNPCLLFFEGGLHGKGGFDIQEFMAFFSAKSFREKFKKGKGAYNKLRKILNREYGKEALKLGLEGAFTPKIKETKTVLDLLMEITRKEKMKIILDAAASSFFKKGKYIFEGKKLERERLLDFYLMLSKNYPIVGIEDPFAQEDWKSFQKITKILGKKIVVIGDDLLVTNLQRIKKAVKKKACNGLILKPNQIGTVSETIEAAKVAMKNKWKVFVKHRSGETKDDFIADLAVGLGAGFIMAGAPSRTERIVKYNRLLEIEKEIKNI